MKIKKIQKEQKRLSTRYDNIGITQNDRLKIFTGKNNFYNNNNNQNFQLNDSFRHKNKNENPKINNFVQKTFLHQKKGENPSSVVDVNDELPYSHKKSYRSPQELNAFMKNH